MRNFLVCILLLAFCGAGAQNQEEISLNFSNLPLKEVLTQIENKTDYQFFYNEDWLPEEPVSGTYNAVNITEVLDDLLKETLLNYYFLNDRIILTQNSVIYDDLPENFFGRENAEISAIEEEESKTYNPVFYEDVEQAEKAPIETVYIGRATRTEGNSQLRLTGRVTSAEDGQPIPNLAIAVRDRNIGTVTNANGYYELRIPPGENIVETSSLGNEDIAKRVVIYNDGELNFNLKEDFQQLGEVLLESNPNSNVSDAIGGTETVNVEDIKNIPLVLGERDILK